ncbi:MAG TPA: ester cyclase [Dehalococcoidia bacterium]|nr:ester cyclase [Dehalococcoidia bacterium]
MNDIELTPLQDAMVAAWERHVTAEFGDKDIEATMATMTAQPFVNHVPVMTGGVGSVGVRSFYSRHFLPGHPDDTVSLLVARTVGANRIVEELVHTFTHDIEMPWILPGVAPTGRKVEVAIVAVVEFEGDKIAGERIYWDQASVLAQVGVLDATFLPVTGAEAARKAMDPASEPSNELIERGGRKGSSAAA